MSYQILGYGYTWWHGDPLPVLPPLAGFRAAPTDEYPLLAELAHLSRAQIVGRVQAGHRPYVAFLHGQPIAYGWSATKVAAIEELGLTFPIPAGNRYLWDFATLPAWRGQGIYPRLLQAILAYEGSTAQRFWVAHTAENHASKRGIITAGFQQVEALAVSPQGSLTILAIGSSRRAWASPMGLHLGVLHAERGEAP